MSRQARGLQDHPLDVMDLNEEVSPNSHRDRTNLDAPLERLMKILNDVKTPRPGGPPAA